MASCAAFTKQQPHHHLALQLCLNVFSGLNWTLFFFCLFTYVKHSFVFVLFEPYQK